MEHDWGLNSEASPEAMFQQPNGPRWRSNNPRLRVREATLNDDATLRLWLHKRARETLDKGLLVFQPVVAEERPALGRFDSLQTDDEDQHECEADYAGRRLITEDFVRCPPHKEEVACCSAELVIVLMAISCGPAHMELVYDQLHLFGSFVFVIPFTILSALVGCSILCLELCMGSLLHSRWPSVLDHYSWSLRCFTYLTMCAVSVRTATVLTRLRPLLSLFTTAYEEPYFLPDGLTMFCESQPTFESCIEHAPIVNVDLSPSFEDRCSWSQLSNACEVSNVTRFLLGDWTSKQPSQMAVFVVLISVELCLFAINHKLRRLVLAPTLFIIAIMILGIFGYVVFFVGMPVVSSEYALPGVDTKLLWSPHLWLNMLRSVIQCYALGFMVNLGYLVRPSVNIPRAAITFFFVQLLITVSFAVIPIGGIAYVMIDNSISWERFRFFDMDLYDTLLPSLVASQDSMKVGGCVVGILAVSMALLVAHETFVLSTYELRSMPRLVSVLHIANTVFHVLCGVLYPKEYHEIADVCDFLIAVPLLILVVCATWVEERHKQYASVGRGATFAFNFGIWLLNFSTVGAVMLQEKRHALVNYAQVAICAVAFTSVTAAVALGGIRVYKRRQTAIRDGGYSSLSSLPWSFMLLSLGNIENFRNNINRTCCAKSSVTFPLIWIVTLKFAVPSLLAFYLIESLNKYAYALQLTSADPESRNLVHCMTLASVSLCCCQMFLAVPFRPLVEWLTYDGRRWGRHAFGDHMTVSLRSIGRD